MHEPRSEGPTAANSGDARGSLLEARSISKRFGNTTALEQVDLDLHAGEIHALMGENGAGKSTLIKCLTGVCRPDGGVISLRGRPIAPNSPRDAERIGISTVYQEVNLIPHLSIAENICLGREPVGLWPPGRIRWGRVRDRAAAAVSKLGLNIDVRRELASCSIAVRQLVAIARATDVDVRVLILDEPTSSLDREEVGSLFEVMRRLRSQGVAVLFVTHFLDQVYDVSDTITVLRDGRRVGTYPTANLAKVRLVGLMVGREFVVPERTASASARIECSPLPVLEAVGMGRRGTLEPLDLSIQKGDAVGLVGLLGSGRTETARLLFGADRMDRGFIRWLGNVVKFRNPRQAIAAGLALSPEDRKTDGIFPNLTVLENIVLAVQARRGIGRAISGAEARTLASGLVRTLGIKAAGLDVPVASLSGGNQQKVLLARWLATEPRLLILDEPTRGIDVAAKAEILREIVRLRERGVAVLFISSELDEVLLVCDRLIVLRDRRKVAELSGTERTEPAVLAAIAQ